MKAIQFLLTVCTVFLAATAVQAQTYYWGVSVGSGWDYDPTTSGTVIIDDPANEVMSARQNIPFPWKFYGKSVTGYRVSENGYITFDTEDTDSDPNNTALPSPEGPNNAIYAFWDDLELVEVDPQNPFSKPFKYEPDQVRNWTYGTAPNRVHVIQWSPVSPTGIDPELPFHIYFAVRLYEGGDFDIVYTSGITHWSRTQNETEFAEFTATIGVENEDGTEGTMVRDSPEELFPGGIDSRQFDDVVLHFIYAEQKSHDLAYFDVTVPEVVQEGGEIVLSGTATNFGTENATQVVLGYRINDGQPQQYPSSIIIEPSLRSDFSMVFPLEGVEAGEISHLHIWVDSINGHVDERRSNDSMTFRILTVLGDNATKRVLIENVTSARAGFGPDADRVIESMLLRPTEVIPVSIHVEDALTTPATTSLASNYYDPEGRQPPMLVLDRILWSEPYSGTLGIPVRGGFGFEPNDMERRFTSIEFENIYTPADIDVVTEFDEATRNLDIDIHVNFVDYALGDFRLHLMIIEDSVTGLGDGYDQANFFSRDDEYGIQDPTHPFYEYPNPIPDFPHRFVVREIPWGAEGKGEIVSEAPAPDDDFTTSFSYSLPDRFNERQVGVVAFLERWSENPLEQFVVNTAFSPLYEQTSGIEGKSVLRGGVDLLYNPVRGRGSVAIDFTPVDGSTVITAVSMDGREFALDATAIEYTEAGALIHFSTESLHTGMYLLRVSSGSEIRWTKMVVVR